MIDKVFRLIGTLDLKPLPLRQTTQSRAESRKSRKIMKNAGHSVRIAANGILAVAAFKEEKLDLILMDLHMPETDGLTAS